MGIWKSMAGMVRLEIDSADIGGLLSALAKNKIELFDILYISGLTIRGNIYRKDYAVCRRIAEQHGCTLHIVSRLGLFWPVKSLVRRPLFLLCIPFLLLLIFFLPSRVLFVTVEGNETIPSMLILEQAELCGIRFGASRRNVRSEKMKNELLTRIPQIQWAGVNTRGCTAVISVQEKSIPDTNQQSRTVSSIVAVRDGVIRICTVTRGNPLCQVGQTVQAGQVLVSGYTDCGIAIQATRAQAEIIAQTLRKLLVVTPVKTQVRGSVASVQKTFSLQIGKKIINFYKDSGISHGTCVKMYTKKNLTLPGGFVLPIALICQQYTEYDTAVQAEDSEDFSWLEEYAERYLKEQMIAGEILQCRTEAENVDGICQIRGEYTCLEMIGRVKDEEIIK